MSKGEKGIVSSVAMVTVLVVACFAATAGAAGGAQGSSRVIVVFDGEVDAKVIKDHGGEVVDSFSSIPAVVAELDQLEIKALKKEGKVSAVEADATASICKKPPSPPGQDKDEDDEPPEEAVGWGVDRIDADLVWGDSTGSSVKVAVLDTGIDKDHPDLPTLAGGVNFVKRGRSVDPTAYDDDNGHGTHCAGIIAGLHDGEIGVKGVAPDVSLYAVKVLNKRGVGYYSDIIYGIEWAADNDMDVLSMSLGGGAYSSAMELACDAAHAAGVVLVASAGNEGSSLVSYPAAFDSVIAVSAIDEDGSFASYSNYGYDIELSAPGTNVLSTYKDGTWKELSGTSMACPHVSGTVALVLEDHTFTGDVVSQVRDLLASTAEDLGSGGWDMYYGNGLVDAEAAYAGA